MPSGTQVESATPATKADGDYARLLQEAAAIRGVSLWQDAWRRLKKSRAAMAGLVFLSLLSLLAFFTPLLPLQSPRFQDLKNRQFLPPSLRPVELDLDLAAVREADQRLRAATSAAWSKNTPEATAARDAVLREHPFNRLWTNPGPLTRQMLRARLALFGKWSLPSVCGTDSLGRDVLSRICWGTRVSLVVGFVAALVSLAIGVSYGAIAGYAGGWTDAAMMRTVDVLDSVPFIYVVIFLLTFLSEPTVKQQLAAWRIDQIMIFYIVIGAIYWLTMARVVRGQVLSLKHEQFVDAARVIGARAGRIVFRHLVPNVLGIVIVYLTLTIPSVMLFEAFLSFLGLGVQPPDVSLGLLVNEGVRVITPLKIFWWLVLFPSVTLALTLFALNFLGDGLRDALDPRLKNR